MRVIGLGTCKSCGHDIAKLANGWAHLKHSAIQHGPKLDHLKDGMLRECCKVEGCNCCTPEPKEEKRIHGV